MILVEILLQLHDVRMVQVLRYLKLPILVSFVLQDVFDGELAVHRVQDLCCYDRLYEVDFAKCPTAYLFDHGVLV